MTKSPLAATYSIVAKCLETGDLGVATATASLAVGSVVPYAEAGVGAIATQASTNIFYGKRGLALMRSGIGAREVLQTVLREDSQRAERQVIMIDKNGETAYFTGEETIQWTGHLAGDDYVVAGNMLRGREILESMAEAFRRSSGPLELRLVMSLEAGDMTGGDKRGKCSAALLVAKNSPPLSMRPNIDLRVDLHDEPVKELKHIFQVYMDFLKQSGARLQGQDAKF